jgi:hypothetical protein
MQTASVRINNKMTDWFLSNSGVKQIVDNIVLVALSEADMQHMLNKLHDWCKR